MLTIVAAELVPSSARSSSSAATPLPTQFVPLLDESLEKVKEAIQRVMPIEKRLSALEEAEFEDEGGEEGALEKEMLSQGWLFFLSPLVLYSSLVRQLCRHYESIGQESSYMGSPVWVKGISVQLLCTI